MPLIDVDALLAPTGSEPPCGPDLEHAPEMAALRVAAEGTPERVAGNKVIPPHPPEWVDVAAQCKELLDRAKHLEVAVLLTRAACWIDGYAGAVRGLALVRGLLENYWDTLYPNLDPDDGSAMRRLNKLAPFTVGSDGAARDLLKDLGTVALDAGAGRGTLTVRDLLLAFGHVEAHSGESVPSEAGATTALRDLLQKRNGLAQSMADAVDHARAIKSLIEEKAPDDAPDLAALLTLVQAVSATARRVTGQDTGTTGPDGKRNGDGPQGNDAKAVGALRTREDCVRALEQVCDWFERNEPSHPAPYVVRRAARLVQMNFLEIIQDMAPNGLGQVQDLVGKEAEPK